MWPPRHHRRLKDHPAAVHSASLMIDPFPSRDPTRLPLLKTCTAKTATPAATHLIAPNCRHPTDVATSTQRRHRRLDATCLDTAATTSTPKTQRLDSRANRRPPSAASTSTRNIRHHLNCHQTRHQQLPPRMTLHPVPPPAQHPCQQSHLNPPTSRPTTANHCNIPPTPSAQPQDKTRAPRCDTLAGPSIDPGAGSVDAETAGNEGPCPSVSLNDPVYIEVENSPVSSDPLLLEDAGDGVDPDDLSDGSDDLVEQTALQRFASALQEAQKVAIQLERDQAHQRRKTSKTYRGNSRTTLFHREKARKVLASEGFLDIRSFMVLKEKEREERKRSSDTPAITDRMTSGGSVVNEEDEGDDSDIVVLPGPADRVRYRGDDSDEGSDVAGDVEGPGPVALSRHEHAEEEEESDGEAEGSRAGGNKSPLYSTRSGWADMSSGAAENRGPGRVAFTQREYAEEEESSEGSEGPKEFLAGPTRRASGCADEESADENAPHSANYEHETDGGVEWDLPGPKRTPTTWMWTRTTCTTRMGPPLRGLQTGSLTTATTGTLATKMVANSMWG
ncbi:hypothetical protein EDB84DRAFT_1442767 [Lactarius hengduanensis]|nr:hypothetical protein EDB84DRAFT_1442767 [Lactarius hengduanensis]